MLDQYGEVVLVDFEFIQPDGERIQRVVCCVARLLKAGTTLRVWRDQFGPAPPYPSGPDVLIVTYNAVAEIGCHLALGWPIPQRVLDLYPEFVALTNTFRAKGTEPPPRASLLAALAHFGLDGIAAGEKRDMIELIIGGGPWSEHQQRDILDYCESDVIALKRLLPAMLPRIDLARALLRGRYMCTVAAMERNGVPIDGNALGRLRPLWPRIARRLIEQVDRHGVYDAEGSWSNERFAQVLLQHDIAWPCHADGKLDLRKETFRDMANAPGAAAIAPLCGLRNSLSGLRLGIRLSVGSDNRNRTSLFPFKSVTGRNQPSSAKYIFGGARWIRGLIKPAPGFAVAYIDWKQQEFGIAAALSGDDAMLEAYRSGDPYLSFAKLAGAAPADATKESHGTVRDLYKQAILAVQYGMAAKSLAVRITRPGMPAEMIARDVLAAHRRTFGKFWSWSEQFVDTASIRGAARTVFGWPARVDGSSNPRSIANFPMQANGAEMMRIACCLAVERGIEVCAPVHDALLITAPVGEIGDTVTAMQACMAEASRHVLTGFELGSDAKIVRYPDRFMDERPGSREMWDRVWQLVDEEQRAAA